MTIEISNNKLDNCNSIEQVVELINNEFSSDATAEMIAAAYALQAANEAGYGVDESNIDYHLDYLKDAGAKFNFNESLTLALNESIKNTTTEALEIQYNELKSGDYNFKTFDDIYSHVLSDDVIDQKTMNTEISDDLMNDLRDMQREMCQKLDFELGL